MDPLMFAALATACAPMVDLGTARAIVQVESSYNRHAIGVVGGRLERQPRSLREATAAARTLRADGRNFSVGLAQINRSNFGRLGLTLESAFNPCANLNAMQVLLQECFERAARKGAMPQRAVRQAVSCYYSGNFVTGFRDGYTARVVRAALHPAVAARPLTPSAKELP